MNPIDVPRGTLAKHETYTIALALSTAAGYFDGLPDDAQNHAQELFAAIIIFTHEMLMRSRDPQRLFKIAYRPEDFDA